MELRRDSRGTLMAPVREFADLCGYDSLVCPSCGDNQLEARDPVRAKREGLVLVKWYRAYAYRSAVKGKIRLAAETERIEGVTWVDIALFKKLGHRYALTGIGSPR